jgi:hypothetical protein
MLKRAVLLLVLTPFLVKTHDMIADIFTKALEKSAFVKFRNNLMNVHGSLRDRLEHNYACTTGSVRRVIGDLMRKL